MAGTADGPEAPPTGASAYRFDRLRLGLVLRDLYFTKTDPGPGEQIVDFDLATLDGGRFRSQDLSETAGNGERGARPPSPACALRRSGTFRDGERARGPPRRERAPAQ